MGMRRDFPPSGNGVDAPRLVVFEVINLKPLKGEVRGADYTRSSRSRRGRSGQARDPGPCRRRRRPCDRHSGSATRQVHRLVRAITRRLHRRHGDQLERAPLGAQAHGPGPGRTDHLGAAGRAVPHGGHERQERRQRRGGDLRGRLAPEDALRARQVDRAAEHAVRAPAARGLQGRPHRLHQPHPRPAGRVRPGLRAKPGCAPSRAS